MHDRDEIRRMHTRITNLSLAIIVVSVSVMLVACSGILFNLEEIIDAWGRIF